MTIVGLKKKIPKYLMIPLIILFSYFIYSGFNKLDERSIYASAHKFMHFSKVSSDLIHELQKERGYSSGFVASRGKSFAKELNIQRAKSDAKLKVLENLLKSFDFSMHSFHFKTPISKFMLSLKDVNQFRSSVDTHKLNSDDVIDYYSKNISILLNLIENLVYISDDSELSVLIQSYVALMKAKEKAGIERALVNKVFVQGKLSNSEFFRFGRLVAAQEIYIKYFNTITVKKYKNLFSKIVLADNNEALNHERNIVYAKNQKNQILSSIKEYVGYGGLIHNFKNYVIRGKNSYAVAVENAHQKLLLAIEKYSIIDGVTKEELDKLKIIKDTFLKYKNGLLKVTQSYKRGVSISSLDKLVKVDDSQAIEAMHELTTNIYGSHLNWFKHSTDRINSLKMIEDILSEELEVVLDTKNDDLIFELIAQFILLIVVIIIIFSLIQMLRELIESEKVLKMAQENTKSGSYEYFIKEDLLIWSDEHYHLLEVDKNSFKPTFKTFEIFIHPEDVDIFFNGMELAKTTKKISFFDYRVILYDNSIKYVRSSAEVIKFNKKGEPLVMIGTLADVTYFKELEQEIVDTQKDVIFTMGAIGETRSKETGSHVKRVAEYSELLCLLNGASENEAELLKMASPMHDIGKVGIPDEILNKPGKLTPDEWAVMQTHAEMGYDMLKNSKREILKLAAVVSLTHHEKYNGTGYPKGLTADEIPMVGRITALADVFDALGSDRCYKAAWELDKILELIKSERAKHFDPVLVDLFFENLDKFLEIRDKYKDTL